MINRIEVNPGKNFGDLTVRQFQQLKTGKFKVKESSVHQQVVNYLKSQYPKVIFRTDFAAGIKMSIGQAVKHKSLQQSRAFPDITIFYPTTAGHALFIEIKRSKDEVFKKDGALREYPHLWEQKAMMNKLIDLGYCARWGCGFDETKEIIDSWIMDKYTER